jgi:hypothetical protein
MSSCTTIVGRAAASRIVLEDKGGGGLVFVGAIRETPRDGDAMGGDLLAIVSSDSPIAMSPIGSRGWVRGLDTDRRASARCRGEITRSTRAITGCALALRAAWRRDREGGESGRLREVWRTVRPRRQSTGFAKGARRVGPRTVRGHLRSVRDSHGGLQACEIREPLSGTQPAKPSGSWLLLRPPISRAVPPRRSFTASSGSTSRPSSRTPASTTTADCRGTLRTSFAGT